MRDPVGDLRDIFLSGIKRADPFQMILDNVKRSGNILQVRDPGYDLTFDLDDYKSIFVIGAGKATANMAAAIEAILKDRITEGVISVKYGHTAPLEVISTIQSGHPIPDENGVRAARLIADMASGADADTLVITLISGGGSALMPAPVKAAGIALSLQDKQETTALLLESGATINEVNCIRKHCSAMKGGRLAELIYPASSLNLILSDVVGDDLDAIASGPTTGDPTSFEDAQAVVEKYGLESRLPAAVAKLLKAGLEGLVQDTPSPGSDVFKAVSNILIGTNYQSLITCAASAEKAGYHPVILSSQIIGEARETGKVLYGIAKDVRRRGLLAKKPVCLIAGGETTVTLRGGGKGGRNQEMALSVLEQMSKSPAEADGVFFLSASTDGNDGPTDAAGAFAYADMLDRAAAGGMSVSAYLADNDSYHFFDALGGLLKTGPTNTNVCDIHIFLIKE